MHEDYRRRRNEMTREINIGDALSCDSSDRAAVLALSVCGPITQVRVGTAYHHFYITDPRKNHTTNVHIRILMLCNAHLRRSRGYV